MLTREQLVHLYRELQDRKVLSVYVDGSGDDPAERGIWGRELENGLSGERARIVRGAPDELEAFDAARDGVLGALERYATFPPGRGWVGFATADGLRYGDAMSVPMPHLVRWERGIRVAPYVRALKQSRLVLAVLVDSQRARLFTYQDGEIAEPIDMVADTDIGDLTDVGMRKGAATHSGRRGQTSSDAAQDLLSTSSARLRSKLVELLEREVGDEGFLVVGGIQEAASALAQSLAHLGDRVLQRPSLRLDMTEAEVRAAVEDAASEMSRHAQEALVSEVVDRTMADGKGCLGPEATELALRERRVDTLLLTRGLRERQSDLADRFVGAAFEQNASVEELSGVGAERLDAEGEGLGARLRYKIRPNRAGTAG